MENILPGATDSKSKPVLPSKVIAYAGIHANRLIKCGSMIVRSAESKPNVKHFVKSQTRGQNRVIVRLESPPKQACSLVKLTFRFDRSIASLFDYKLKVGDKV